MTAKPTKLLPRSGRRAFLRGVGTVTLGLPFLDVFARQSARAADVPSAGFAIFVRQGNGVAQAGRNEPERFWPRQLGALTQATLGNQTDRAVSELAGFADKLTLVRGTRFAFPGNGCGHSGGGNQCLTAARVSASPSGGKSLGLGESVDNRIARALNPEGRESLALMTGGTTGYLPVVMSYRDARQLRAPENNPWRAYTRLTGLIDMDSGTGDEVASSRRSVNDLVRTHMQRLLGRTDLSSEDRRRLDLHFSSIRDLEVKLSCSLPELRQLEMEQVNPLSGRSYQDISRMHMDIIAMAIACGYTRSATLQLGQGNDGTQFSIPGFRGGVTLPRYHQISHRIYSDGSNGPPIEGAQTMHHEIDKLHARLFRYLLERLDAYGLDGGTLLDQGVAVWLNDLAHGVSHSYNNIPFVLAGSCHGFLRTGRYIDAGNVTHNKLYNTLLTAVGVRKSNGDAIDDFGDASLERGMIGAMLA